MDKVDQPETHMTQEATIEYLKRKDRYHHPEGKIDKAGRWYPSDEERMPCCNRIRRPSRGFPWSYMTHCRTLKHICNLYRIQESEVRFMLSKKGLALLVGSGDSWVNEYLEKKFKGKGSITELA